MGLTERIQFGNTDMMVSRLGVGTSEIGFRATPQDIVDQLLSRALDAGINVIDTAECYVDSEEKIGKAVSHRRDDYYLFTKLGHTSGLPGEDWEPSMLRASIDRSLERLNTDRVDLLQLHSCSVDLLRTGEVIEVIQQARREGKTRYIGYSGDRESAEFALELGVFDSLQTSCNIFDQQCIDLTLPTAKKSNVAVIAKRPIGNAVWLHEAEPVDTYGHPYWLRMKQLGFDLGEDPLEIALRFTLAQDIHVAIVGTSNPARIAGNVAAAAKGALSAECVSILKNRWREIAEPSWVGQT